MTTPLRLAVTPIGGAAWTGGARWLANLLGVLRRHPACGVEAVLLAGLRIPADELAALEQAHGAPAIRDPACDAVRGLRGTLQALACGRQPAFERLLVRVGADAYLEWAQYCGWDMRVPMLAWIPDLQHRRLASLFSLPDRLRREIGFRLQIAHRRTILLSSRAARRDLLALYPLASAQRIAVAPFASLAGTATPPTPPDELRRRLGIDGPFVHLPNQFWRHKNHGTVVRALARLGQAGPQVIATGAPGGGDGEARLRACLATVGRLGLADRFRHLGLVGYPDLLGLMRTARAVLNPSLFEGWSTTVEEGKALGCPLILSDIPVHREQAPAAWFFPPGDHVALADLLRRSLGETPPRCPVPDGAAAEGGFAQAIAQAVRMAACAAS